MNETWPVGEVMALLTEDLDANEDTGRVRVVGSSGKVRQSSSTLPSPLPSPEP